jgi:hypothetical protein
VDGSVAIHDTRPGAGDAPILLGGVEAAVLDACDAGRTWDDLLKDSAFESVDPASVRHALDKLSEARVVANIGGYYLSLAVEAPVRDYPQMSQRPGGGWIGNRNRNRNQKPKPSEQTIVEAYGLVCQ